MKTLFERMCEIARQPPQKDRYWRDATGATRPGNSIASMASFCMGPAASNASATMATWKDSLQRRDEVKAAFIEGYCACVDAEMKDVPNGKAREYAEAAWLLSDARKALEKPLA